MNNSMKYFKVIVSAFVVPLLAYIYTLGINTSFFDKTGNPSMFQVTISLLVALTILTTILIYSRDIAFSWWWKYATLYAIGSIYYLYYYMWPNEPGGINHLWDGLELATMFGVYPLFFVGSIFVIVFAYVYERYVQR